MSFKKRENLKLTRNSREFQSKLTQFAMAKEFGVKFVLELDGERVDGVVHESATSGNV